MTLQRVIVAIDQGTTGSTCLVLDERAQVIGRGYSEFRQHYPQPGWVEHDADEIWDVTLHVAREAIAASGRDVEIAGIGITNQRETVVVWDRKTGTPVGRAIVWQDRRTADICRSLKSAGKEEWVRARTGLVLDPYFSGTKLTWMLQNDPKLRARAEAGELAAGTIDCWLIWKLTGGRVHATDPTNASRTLLYNIDTQSWDDELCALLEVPKQLLPEVLPSSGVFGETDPALFGRSIPVAGVAGDQQAALFGQGCVTAGQAKNTYGTGAFLLLNTGAERVASKHGLLTTVACASKGEACYALEGSIFIAGASIQWLRDELKIIGHAAETDEIARSVADNGGVYLVPAFVGLGAPHWDPDARGALVGLTRGSTRAHVVRAALESMAYSTHDVLEAMISDSGVKAAELAVDGGASQNDWLMQFQADILDLPVVRPKMVECTAAGAAGLAGIGAGVWQDAEEYVAVREEPVRFDPSMSGDERNRLINGWKRAVHATIQWARATHQTL